MPISTAATISFPLDIPQVDVLATKQTRDGKFIITVESRRETTKCGACQQEIACNYGHGQAVRLRHLPILGKRPILPFDLVGRSVQLACIVRRRHKH